MEIVVAVSESYMVGEIGVYLSEDIDFYTK